MHQVHETGAASSPSVGQADAVPTRSKVGTITHNHLVMKVIMGCIDTVTVQINFKKGTHKLQLILQQHEHSFTSQCVSDRHAAQMPCSPKAAATASDLQKESQAKKGRVRV